MGLCLVSEEAPPLVLLTLFPGGDLREGAGEGPVDWTEQASVAQDQASN